MGDTRCCPSVYEIAQRRYLTGCRPFAVILLDDAKTMKVQSAPTASTKKASASQAAALTSCRQMLGEGADDNHEETSEEGRKQRCRKEPRRKFKSRGGGGVQRLFQTA